MLRWKPVAIFCSGVALGSRSPASLLDGELVERHVPVEGVDDPVAVGPDGAAVVLLVAVGVGVAGQVEPGPGLVFAVVRRGQQPVDRLLVGVGRPVVARKASTSAGVGGRPVRSRLTRAQQRRLVRLRRRRQPSCSSRASTKASMPLRGQAVFLTRRRRRLHRLDVGPVLLVLRRPGRSRPRAWRSAPAVSGSPLGGIRSSGSAALTRWSSGCRRACRARGDGTPNWSVLQAPVAPCRVEAALLQVGAVALEAAVRQDGPNVAVEADLAVLARTAAGARTRRGNARIPRCRTGGRMRRTPFAEAAASLLLIIPNARTVRSKRNGRSERRVRGAGASSGDDRRLAAPEE